jgi:hypothetical protein
VDIYSFHEYRGEGWDELINGPLMTALIHGRNKKINVLHSESFNKKKSSIINTE